MSDNLSRGEGFDNFWGMYFKFLGGWCVMILEVNSPDHTKWNHSYAVADLILPLGVEGCAE